MADNINVTSRTIYERGRRRSRRVFDAIGWLDGVEYYVQGAPSKQDAIDRARADVTFIKREPKIRANGFALIPHRAGEFLLQHPSGCGFCFAADNRRAALDKLAIDYHYRPDILAFIEAARQQVTP
jgi:hypothetical protein